ncbi:MAG: response regulator [Methylococcales bacterium]|nr:response regulator [Methylococcales bacterium]MBT7445706.1 response regulator [Methylococcales bacterium]
MPGIDGFELLAKIKPDFKQGKFAILTANTQDTTKQKAEALGAICVSKPVKDACIGKMLEYFDA